MILSYSDCYQIFICSVLEVELHVHVPVISLRSMWCIMEDWVEFNSACNHVNDKKKSDDHVVGVRFANHETVYLI